MKIIVCIKQVPQAEAEMDWETGTIIRNGTASILNPYDKYAIEAALQIKDNLGGHVTAITMGPETAESVLREAISMGVDDGVLLSDRSFAGADVYATAYTISQGINKIGKFDLVICGQQSTDGDTAQLPASLATQLDIPVLAWVKSFNALDKSSGAIVATLTNSITEYMVKFPILISIENESNQPRLSSLKNKMTAKKAEIKKLALTDFGDQNPQSFGLKGSPTKVIKIINPDFQHLSEPIELPADKVAMEIKSLINNRGGSVNGI